MNDVKIAAPVHRINPITNIGELFEVMAVGWSENSWERRILIAGDGGQFVRTQLERLVYPFYRMGDGDIPVVTGTAYSMVGFLKFENRMLYRGMFAVSRADDSAWWAAELTPEGYAAACDGVTDFDSDQEWCRHIPFFNPRSVAVERDPQLTNEHKATP